MAIIENVNVIQLSGFMKKKWEEYGAFALYGNIEDKNKYFYNAGCSRVFGLSFG